MKATKQIWFWAAAGVAAAVALGPPVRALAVNYLFSARMFQHILLQLVAPPLFLLGMQASGASQESRLRPWQGAAMWLSGVGAMWVWHAPFFCNAVSESAALRWFEEASLLAMGVIFWWPIAGPRRDWRLPPLLGVLYLFTACLGCTALGIVVTFAPPDLYARFFHADLAPGVFRDWVTTPAEDQRLGGLLMWVPACFIYITAILGLLNRWYSEPEMGAAMPSPSPAPH